MQHLFSYLDTFFPISSAVLIRDNRQLKLRIEHQESLFLEAADIKWNFSIVQCVLGHAKMFSATYLTLHFIQIGHLSVTISVEACLFNLPFNKASRSPDMSNTTFFTPIPIPNISKEALTIPNTNTNFLMSP